VTTNREPPRDEQTPLTEARVALVPPQRSTEKRTVLVVADQADRGRLVARRRRGWDKLLTKLRARSLDTQLAGGASPDDAWLRAVRAAALVAPATRLALAGDWENLLERARGPQPVAGARVPLARARILAAEDEIGHLVAALRSLLPVPVRGAAMANLLITDGRGPVYNRRSTRDLGAAVREAVRFLDPFSDLMEPVSQW